MRFVISPPVLSSLLSLLLVSGASAESGPDPFATGSLLPPRLWLGTTPAGSGHESPEIPCPPLSTAATLTLADVVQQALCRNPQTQEVWANARVQAAQVGVAKAAYLPNLSATVSGSRGRSDSSGQMKGTQQAITRGDVSWLLYDFGARGAALDNAKALLAASAATQASTVQAVFLAAVQAYYQVQASQSVLEAANASEQAAATSFKAADARFKAGTNTRADQLQAQTAWAQATLARIQAEGTLKTAQGTLATVMGLDAPQPLRLSPLTPPPTQQRLSAETAAIDSLIASARKARPDLLAAEAQVQAAQASVDQARANGRPTLNLTGSSAQTRSEGSASLNASSIGVSLVVPLFSGFSPTYKIRAAEAQVESKQASRDRIALQVAQDVWKARSDLETASQSLKTASSLLASARESEQMALGRYQAGVGTLVDLLTAQSAHANARQQLVKAQYDWYVARATLAQALGTLDFTFLPALAGNAAALSGTPSATSGTTQP
jgi:TolC family type I secretion outer membrane protein